MDAGVGVSTKDFWLWGGTGNFNQLGSRGQFMDNILYGIRDRDYPFFRHLNGVQIPRETDAHLLKELTLEQMRQELLMMQPYVLM